MRAACPAALLCAFPRGPLKSMDSNALASSTGKAKANVNRAAAAPSVRADHGGDQ